MEYSQNGYRVINSLSDCRRYSVKGGQISLPLRPDDCGYVLAHFANRFNREIENLNNTDCHGYNKRQIYGSSEWSNHASATAIDLNATQHRSGHTNTFTNTQEALLENILEDDYDSVFKWGGTYRSVVDEMHFEINVEYSKVRLLAQVLRKNNTLVLFRLKPGYRNIYVYMLKRVLKRKGYYSGPMNKYFSVELRKAYAGWQRSLGYSGADANGLPGVTSLKALGFRVEGG